MESVEGNHGCRSRIYPARSTDRFDCASYPGTHKHSHPDPLVRPMPRWAPERCSKSMRKACGCPARRPKACHLQPQPNPTPMPTSFLSLSIGVMPSVALSTRRSSDRRDTAPPNKSGPLAFGRVRRPRRSTNGSTKARRLRFGHDIAASPSPLSIKRGQRRPCRSKHEAGPLGCGPRTDRTHAFAGPACRNRRGPRDRSGVRPTTHDVEMRRSRFLIGCPPSIDGADRQ